MRTYAESATVNTVFVRNGSTSGYANKTENGTVPASSPYILELEEVIHDSSTLVCSVNAVTANTVPWSFAPAAGEIAVDRARGLLKFNADDAGLAVEFTYKPAGTRVSAAAMADMVVDEDHTHDDRYYTESEVDAALATKQDEDTDLTAIAGLASSGIIARTGAGTAAVRTITGTGSNITVTNGAGTAGSPTIDVGSNIPRLNAANVYSTTQFFNGSSGSPAITGDTAGARIRFYGSSDLESICWGVGGGMVWHNVPTGNRHVFYAAGVEIMDLRNGTCDVSKPMRFDSTVGINGNTPIGKQPITETSADPAITEIQDILIAFGVASDNR